MKTSVLSLDNKDIIEVANLLIVFYVFLLCAVAFMKAIIFLNDLLFSLSNKYRCFRNIFLSIFLFIAIFSIVITFSKFSDPNFIKGSDLTQDFLMGQAIKEGIDPYSNLPDLFRRYLGTPNQVNPHPSPHAPLIGILFYILSGISLQWLTYIWAITGILQLLYVIFFILKIILPATPVLRPLCFSFSLVISSLPLSEELLYGQFGIVFLFLMTLAWYAFRTNQDFLSGCLIGICLSLKYFGWPFLLVCSLTGRWRMMIGTLMTFSSVQVISYLVLGRATFVRYFSEVLPEVGRIWSNSLFNISIYSVILRIFQAPRYFADARVGKVIQLAPKTFPIEIKLFALLTCCLLVIYFVVKCYKSNDRDVIFMGIATISIVANPIAWAHYLTVLVLPLTFLIARLIFHRKLEKAITVIILLIMILYYQEFSFLPPYSDLSQMLVYEASLARVLVSCVPTVAVIIISLLIFKNKFSLPKQIPPE